MKLILNRYLTGAMLVAILFAGCLLRLVNLTTNPAGFWPDEAYAGYDAYCLLQSGRDHQGNVWPFFFSNYADDISGTYQYIVLVSELILGPTILAVRLPSALISCLCFLTLYLGVACWLGKKAAIISAFFLAFSPWHLPFCRVGQRIMLLPLGLTLWFWIWIRNKGPAKPYLQWIILGLTVYTYHSARVIVPLLALAIAVIEFKYKRQQTREILLGLALVGIIFVPLIQRAIEKPEVFQTRFQQISVFKQYPRIDQALIAAVKNHFSHFSPDFLFITGDQNLRHNQKGVGLLLWGQLPLVLIGLFLMFRAHTASDLLILFLMLISPLPSAFTIEGNPHALRSITMLIALLLITARGAQALIDQHRKLSFARILTWILIPVSLVNAVTFAYDLLYRYPEYSAEAWEYGTREAIHRCLQLKEKYQEFWFTHRALGAEGILAFELLIPPEQYWKQGLLTTQFRKYPFVPVRELFDMASAQKRLFIVRADELTEFPDAEAPVMRPDGSIAFRFVLKNPDY